MTGADIGVHFPESDTQCSCCAAHPVHRSGCRNDQSPQDCGQGDSFFQLHASAVPDGGAGQNLPLSIASIKTLPAAKQFCIAVGKMSADSMLSSDAI